MSSSATTPIRGSSLLKSWSCLPHFRLEMTWETASPLLHGQNIVQICTNVDWAANAKKRAQSIQGNQTIVGAAEESTFEAILNT